MSGHSKWHNIQKTKGAQDAKRAQAFTKIAREMIVAVKEGGSGDPNNNSRLAAVIAKAKAANMPNDNIKRTIDKALGSFAAELIPATVECDGVTFAMGEANTDDAVLCNGQTVALPADRTYTKLYVLASAVEEPRTAEFRVGDRTYEAEVPLWKGFYGQWGWYGNSEGFMQRAKIGYLGTHRHQTDLGNVPYGFSYMYLLTFDIPEGATTVTLPKDKKVLVYAMTASNNPIDDVKLASRTFVRPDER